MIKLSLPQWSLKFQFYNEKYVNDNEKYVNACVKISLKNPFDEPHFNFSNIYIKQKRKKNAKVILLMITTAAILDF